MNTYILYISTTRTAIPPAERAPIGTKDQDSTTNCKPSFSNDSGIDFGLVPL
ncbi:MAG: hypothetical protein ACQESG_07015 [Nanobdellota archaeon]